jgi:three-Cys-motif partner protein
MSSSKKNDVISVASPHSVKKFELISEYVKAWIQILMQNEKCKGIVYIDCMSNSGIYKNDKNEEIEGTPLLVAKIIADAMQTYSTKQAYVYFNDIDSRKIDLLNTRLPRQTSNFHIHTEAMDANQLLRKIGDQFRITFPELHFLLVYDPYDAHIEWDALTPFLKNWGEVIINHVVSDTIRAAKMAKTPEAVGKYEETYQMSINQLVEYGSDRCTYEKIIEQIILNNSDRKYYVAAFPFFNSNNALVYHLIHCTGHFKGFELFKSTAWKIFGDQSSTKHIHKSDDGIVQLRFTETGEIMYDESTDESCYTLRDIALYLQRHFAGQVNVPNDDVWKYLGQHPVFPTKDYKNKIKSQLKQNFGMKASRSTMSFSPEKY